MSEDNQTASALAIAMPLSSQPERKYALTLTGSDGRRERGSRSDLSYILVVDGASESHVREVVESVSVCERRRIAEIEIKDIGEHGMNYFNNNPDLIFPSRVLDARLVCGSPDLHYAAKEKLVTEWQTGHMGLRIAERLRHRRSEFRAVLQNGGRQKFNQHTLLRHYDLEEGVAYYDPEGKVLSFKAGPLRYVQYALVHELIKFGRKSTLETIVEVVTNIPSSTVEKIRFLDKQGVLAISKGEQAALMESYDYFLCQYRAAQDVAGETGRAIIPFDRTCAKEMLADISRILSKDLLRKC